MKPRPEMKRRPAGCQVPAVSEIARASAVVGIFAGRLSSSADDAGSQRSGRSGRRLVVAVLFGVNSRGLELGDAEIT